MTTLLLFGPLFLFSFVSAFLISLIKLIIWPKFSTDKRQSEDMWGRTIGSCSVSKSDKNGECLKEGMSNEGTDTFVSGIKESGNSE